MNSEIKVLSEYLVTLGNKLMSTPRNADGFGEMKILYRELTRKLIEVGDKANDEIAREIHKLSEEIVEEWESNKSKLNGWMDVLSPVVDAVGAVLKVSNLANPLTLLIPH